MCTLVLWSFATRGGARFAPVGAVQPALRWEQLKVRSAAPHADAQSCTAGVELLMTRQLYRHSTAAHLPTQVSVREASTNPRSLCWPPPLPLHCVGHLFPQLGPPAPCPGCHHTVPCCSPASISQPLVLRVRRRLLPRLPAPQHCASRGQAGWHPDARSRTPAQRVWEQELDLTTALTLECCTIFYEACFPGTGRFICINLSF